MLTLIGTFLTNRVTPQRRKLQSHTQRIRFSTVVCEIITNEWQQYIAIPK